MQSGSVLQLLLAARLLLVVKAIAVTDFSPHAVPDVVAEYAVATSQYLSVVASLECHPCSCGESTFLCYYSLPPIDRLKAGGFAPNPLKGS